MLKRFLSLTALAVVFVQVLALAGPDEGMWLPMYLKKLNEKDMQKAGLKLSADDIYNINKSSVKDAIMVLNGGSCTGEIVSDQGLMLTNHHCGYDNIAKHSTEAHNYLEDGFWAMKREAELPNPGMTVARLVYMDDVTELIKRSVSELKNKDVAPIKVQKLKDSIAKAAMEGNDYKAQVKEFFGGNEYYLLVYEVFKDVRLVGAPPSSIGKFGGDVDNWMWPRHTGDFSVFRIYTGPDGKPADFSPDNIPYKPKHFLPVSLKGVKEGDYAMIMGFPGSTDRYLTSYDLELARDKVNPAIIEALGTQLKVMKKDMDADPALKIAMASDYASSSNSYKYFVGQELQLKHANVIDLQRKEEAEFQKWVNANEQRKEKYGKLLDDIQARLKARTSIEPALSYFFYGFFNSGAMQHSFNFYRFFRLSNSQSEKPSKSEKDSFALQMKALGEEMKAPVAAYFDGPTVATDKKVLKAILIKMYNDIPEASRPSTLNDIVARGKGKSTEEAISAYIDEVYERSAILDKDKALAFLDKPGMKKLEKDPMYKLMVDMISYYGVNLAGVYSQSAAQLEESHKLYIEALREWKKDKTFYPDANSTLRLTYGTVIPYYPRDAVFYNYYTTAQGILEKEDPNDPEFKIPQRLHDLLAKKEYGRYAQNDTLRINFLTNNDITGGNSGSPVMDAEGNLIGLAFDGNWESMIGDLYVDPTLNRTIVADIRYVLWVIDVYAGAGHLVKEMKIVSSNAGAQLK